jgi:hypothetical protein
MSRFNSFFLCGELFLSVLNFLILEKCAIIFGFGANNMDFGAII